jgi:hypothetical protein
MKQKELFSVIGILIKNEFYDTGTGKNIKIYPELIQTCLGKETVRSGVGAGLLTAAPVLSLPSLAVPGTVPPPLID